MIFKCPWLRFSVRSKLVQNDKERLCKESSWLLMMTSTIHRKLESQLCSGPYSEAKDTMLEILMNRSRPHRNNDKLKFYKLSCHLMNWHIKSLLFRSEKRKFVR